MSRVGKKLIPLPKGVKITVNGDMLVEGPKGQLHGPERSWEIRATRGDRHPSARSAAPSSVRSLRLLEEMARAPQ